MTDIENSTSLWECLEQEIMNNAIELHHALIRDLLKQHCGYESATEGWCARCRYSTTLLVAVTEVRRGMAWLLSNRSA